MTCQFCGKEGEKLDTQFHAEGRTRTFWCRHCGKVIRIEKRDKDFWGNTKPVNTIVIMPEA